MVEEAIVKNLFLCNLSSAPLEGKLLALTANIRLISKDPAGKSTVAYFTNL